MSGGLQELLDLYDVDHDDPHPFAHRLVAEIEGASLRLDLGIRWEYVDRADERWIVVAGGVREHRLADFGGPLQLHEDHPLVWEHADPRAELYFHGRPADAAAVIIDLYERHREIVGRWIPFPGYLRLHDPSSGGRGLRGLLEWGYGVLAAGPERVIRGLEEVVAAAALRPSVLVVGPASRWDPDARAWLVPTSRPSALILGDSYVVADEFRAERAPTP